MSGKTDSQVTVKTCWSIVAEWRSKIVQTCRYSLRRRRRNSMPVEVSLIAKTEWSPQLNVTLLVTRSSTPFAWKNSIKNSGKTVHFMAIVLRYRPVYISRLVGTFLVKRTRMLSPQPTFISAEMCFLDWEKSWHACIVINADHFEEDRM